MAEASSCPWSGSPSATVLFAFFGNCCDGSLGIYLCHAIDLARVQVVVSLVGDSQSVSAASKQGLSLPAGVGS